MPSDPLCDVQTENEVCGVFQIDKQIKCAQSNGAGKDAAIG